MHLPDGTLLQGGKYRIVRFIASGGFGCTYEAQHVLFGNRIAIKEFFVKDFCNRDETTHHVTTATRSKAGLVTKLKKKFIEEASAINRLNHPNIVRVFDVFEENGTAYYVMDYIDGRTVHEMLKAQGTIPEAQAIKYITQVAEALREVHAHNRLHLDIKPGNIIIDTNDKAILIDFGASKQYVEVDGEDTSTIPAYTPGYAPLEQIGKEMGIFLPATDIYALGATLYKMLTSVTPKSSTILASGESLDPIPGQISRRTRNAVTACMQSNKGKRPQTIDEFLSLLPTKEQKEPKKPKKEPVPDPEATLINESKPALPTPKKRKRWWTYVLLVCLIGAIGCAAGLIVGVLYNFYPKTTPSRSPEQQYSNTLVQYSDTAVDVTPTAIDPKSTTDELDWYDLDKPDSTALPSLNDAIAYLDSNKFWTRSELESYPDLHGLYDEMNNFKYERLYGYWAEKLKDSRTFARVAEHARHGKKKKPLVNGRNTFNKSSDESIKIITYLNAIDP